LKHQLILLQSADIVKLLKLVNTHDLIHAHLDSIKLHVDKCNLSFCRKKGAQISISEIISHRVTKEQRSTTVINSFAMADMRSPKAQVSVAY